MPSSEDDEELSNAGREALSEAEGDSQIKRRLKAEQREASEVCVLQSHCHSP